MKFDDVLDRLALSRLTLQDVLLMRELADLLVHEAMVDQDERILCDVQL